MTVELDFLPVLGEWPMLLTGVCWTLALTFVSVLIGTIVAVAGAWCRSNGPVWAAVPAGVYVEVVRNTPFIVQLFFIYYGLPSLGLRMSPHLASVLAMTLNLGAYGTEIVRAGLLATPRGQIEAAQSLALTSFQVFTRVVIPPALKRGSSVCGQISTEELSYAAGVIRAVTFRTFEPFIIVMLIYLLLAIGLRRFLNWFGPRYIFG